MQKIESLRAFRIQMERRPKLRLRFLSLAPRPQNTRARGVIVRPFRIQLSCSADGPLRFRNSSLAQINACQPHPIVRIRARNFQDLEIFLSASGGFPAHASTHARQARTSMSCGARAICCSTIEWRSPNPWLPCTCALASATREPGFAPQTRKCKSVQRQSVQPTRACVRSLSGKRSRARRKAQVLDTPPCRLFVQ